MDNPFSLTFTMRQHTPLIHFQHDQAGATLRATEVKPKLDKFIMRQLLKKENVSCESYEIQDRFKQMANESKPEWRDWLVGRGKTEHVALDYKLKILTIGKDQSIWMEPEQDQRNKWQTSFPAFFANMGKDNEKELKNFSFYDHISVQIVTTNSGLSNQIKKYFRSFLLHTNFGSRQSKGFGSFYLHPDDPQFKRLALKYSFSVDVAGIDTRSKRLFYLFNSIDLFFRTLRSGINLKGRGQSDKLYLKSLMAQYSFQEKSSIQWDKKAIRDHFELGTQPYNQADANRGENSTFHFQTNKPHRLMRDMLGLSSEESWFAYRDTITKSNAEISRFKSPIHFKPLLMGNEFRVYFEALQIPSNYYGQQFEISHKPSDRQRATSPAKTLSTPHSDQEFDLDDFLEYVYGRKDNIELSIEAAPSGEYEANLITNLFRSLKKHIQ